ncbi:MAG: hypothetical protein ACXWIU_02110 [Limisphaerales bacterium]
MRTSIILVIAIGLAVGMNAAERPGELTVGIAQHAFDHLGEFNDQAEAAAASGATVIYSTGFGAAGYAGLPAEDDIKALATKTRTYLAGARKRGIQLAIGYVCATSIVKLDTFDKNWSETFRKQFSSKPSTWLQVGVDGKPLPSWYGGDYLPACMNNPDWQTYEKAIVKMQLDAGHDGIFFDNPTVHPQGCYCEHCMRKFQRYLVAAGVKVDVPSTGFVGYMRKVVAAHPQEFARFRCTIARDFLEEIQKFARTIKPKSIITCNNSLNAPTVFFAQSRNYAYNIHEMSKVEDLVVVEDESSQPRTLPNGSTVEYGHMYELLHAISHHKPVVAVTIVDGDYHTAPNLMRLAMAEAAAHNASYLSWPTWPEKERERMCAAVRPEADLLRTSAPLLNLTPRRADVVFYIPFEKWPTLSDTELINCVSVLENKNIQFVAACEDNIGEYLKAKPMPVVVALGKRDDIHLDPFRTSHGVVVSTTDDKNWIGDMQKALKNPPTFKVPPSVRVVVRDQPERTIVHLLNLNVQRISSFEDKVTPVFDISLKLHVPLKQVRSVEALTADESATQGTVEFAAAQVEDGSDISFQVPSLDISTIIVIQ